MIIGGLLADAERGKTLTPAPSLRAFYAASRPATDAALSAVAARAAHGWVHMDTRGVFD